MKHRVAEDEVERVVRRMAARLPRTPPSRRPAPSSAADSLSLREHARRDVRGHRLADHAGAQQVEREVAGARADLERARVAARLVPERLAELAGHLRLADVAVADAPLRVVVLRRRGRGSGRSRP